MPPYAHIFAHSYPGARMSTPHTAIQSELQMVLHVSTQFTEQIHLLQPASERQPVCLNVISWKQSWSTDGIDED